MILSTIAGTPQPNLMSRNIGIKGLCRTKPQTSLSLQEILNDTKEKSLIESHQRDWINEIKWLISIMMVAWVFGSFCYSIQITSRRIGAHKRWSNISQWPLANIILFRPTLRFCYRTKTVPEQSELLQAES